MAALTIVAQTRPFVIGVDCHARTHTYVIIEANTKRQVACEQFPTTQAGIFAHLPGQADGQTAIWPVYGPLRVSGLTGQVWPGQ